VHHVSAAELPVGNVVLAHGMFSNFRTFRGLARYLGKLNYDCWLLDSQGHGYSDTPDEEPDLESMSLADTEAVLGFVKELNGLPVWWIGHSGGGLAILMYLARNPGQQQHVSGVVMLASQATDAGLALHRRMILRCAKLLVRVLGVAPGKALRLGPENEFARVMDQWLRWSLSGHWIGAGAFDYSQRVMDIRIPSLTIAASADRFIAPASGCKKIHLKLGSNDKTFLIFGKATGYSEDYSHARVISSRAASIDVWPVIGNWLQKRSVLPDQT